MAFLPLQDEALLGDAGKNVILLTSPITGNATLTQVAASTDGISQPIAVAASADGKTALVANSSGTATVRIDLSRQTPSVKVACQCSPSELVPLSGNLVFRLNEPGSGAVWAFDGDSAKSRIVFLPAERLTSAAGATQ
jgi:DNA-binding beta-propeller fold protein YncE